MGQAISLAKKKNKDGSPEEAKRIYQDILTKFPKNKRASDGLKGASKPTANKASKVKFVSTSPNCNHCWHSMKKDSWIVIEKQKPSRKQYPKAFDVWNLMGAKAAQIGQLDQARAFPRASFAIKPDYADAYYNMGKVLKEQGPKKDSAMLGINRLSSKALKILKLMPTTTWQCSQKARQTGRGTTSVRQSTNHQAQLC